MMTLTELARLEAQATPGPWKTAPVHWGECGIHALHGDGTNRCNGEPVTFVVPVSKLTFDDAALIAAMRNHLPALLAVAKAAQEFVAVQSTAEVDWEAYVALRAALDALEQTK
jgi:hypothetical protein